MGVMTALVTAAEAVLVLGCVGSLGSVPWPIRTASWDKQ